MERKQLEHLIRAASSIADDNELVVIGSQSILGSVPDAPASLCMSMEADIYPRNRPERSDLIDGSIGEGSPFEQTFGYYAQGVGPDTAVLPKGWEGRLTRVENENTHGSVGYCLDVHDLALSKYVANREKDREFNRELMKHGLVKVETLQGRVDLLPIEEIRRSQILGAIKRDAEQVSLAVAPSPLVLNSEKVRQTLQGVGDLDQKQAPENKPPKSR
jgi:hypothetical protein